MYMYSRNQEADPGYDVRNENPLYVKLVDINPRLHYDNEEKFRERKTFFFFFLSTEFQNTKFQKYIQRVVEKYPIIFSFPLHKTNTNDGITFWFILIRY